MENETIYITDYTEWTKGKCKKCHGIKYWNAYYRSDNHLCDDCLSPTGLYYDLTDEQAQKIEHEIAWIVSDRIGDIKHEVEYKFHAVQFVLKPFFEHTKFKVFGEKQTYTKSEFIEKFKDMEVISVVPINNEFVLKLQHRAWHF